MGMNPDTGLFEQLTAAQADDKRRAGWPVFEIGEKISVRGWLFEVEECEGRSLKLRGVGPDQMATLREQLDGGVELSPRTMERIRDGLRRYGEGGS